ncbi:MAG: 4-hydroxy-tetrahydrodipicolinate synthase [Deltaproteobacteria bacterium]|nr:4-hydroxy-tetrahydrodipicolinate synthase [Deltaproteobacteria bacterium]
MLPGCYTALITPITGDSVDIEGLNRLVAFQIENGISGLLAVGTTGESPTLTWDEHISVIRTVASQCKGRCVCIAGTGSNNTAETLEATRQAAESGIDGVLLVDPYYNGPSSMEIRREYIAPVAEIFPGLDIIPYIIPGRTGAQLLPEDLAILAARYDNISSVKEATGNMENMKKTRACCGPDFKIFSGDDSLTFSMMTDPDIRATGAISVISNIAPRAVSDMVKLTASGDTTEGEKRFADLTPLFDLVTVKTLEKTGFGDAVCRARNPLPIKTLMRILGFPSGDCRRPLGKMTRQGIDRVIDTARRILADAPYILEPAADFFGIDMEGRLNDPATAEGLFYDQY